jgi:glycosyltransferase involved in cell wall biosynthesis
MRIAIIYLGRRGAGEILSMQFARSLSDLADTLTIISKQAEHSADWEKSGLHIFPVDTFEKPHQAILSLLDLRPIKRLAQTICDWRPDVLFFPMSHPWNSVLQSFIKDIPSVIIVHDAVPHPGLVDRFYALQENQSIRFSSHVITFSSAMADAMENRGVTSAHLTVVPHPIYDYYRTFHSSFVKDLQDTRPHLLFFGRVTEYKGVEVLLQAYARLPLENRPLLKIVGAGNLSPYKKYFDVLPDLHVENRWISDQEIPRFFSPGTIVILPYTSSSQSGVIEIAAAFGLPVIASRVGGIPEQIRDEETGLLIEPGNVEQLCAAIQRLVDHQGLAQSLGENLRKVSEKERGWKETSNRIYNVFSKVAAR